MLRKRALELDEINKEFKTKLNSLLKVGYKYKVKIAQSFCRVFGRVQQLLAGLEYLNNIMALFNMVLFNMVLLTVTYFRVNT